MVVRRKSAIEKPTFKGTRIPVSDVIELLATGLSIEEIVRDYYPSLSEDMVKEALHWVAKIMRGERCVGVSLHHVGGGGSKGCCRC